MTFASGPATRFANTVNGRTHQQTPLVTYRGYQYVTYFDASRRVCIGRRKLPNRPWEIISFTDHKFETNDSHNTTVIGICDKDGTIHMAFDHHASPLNYRVSKRGVAHKPEAFEWNSNLFGKISHTLGSVAADKKVTYPRFFPAPNGNLMLFYRAVTSANGDGMVEEYDGDRHDWTPGLGKFISRDLGTYRANKRKSLYRCPYMNSLSYEGNRLHASWVWRDRFEKTQAINQHDLCYTYSDDDGRTWRNSKGRLIGITGRKPIYLKSKGLVVAPIGIRRGLTNQNTHYAYPDGSIHVMLNHKSKVGTPSENLNRYQHHWRTTNGTWKHQTVAFTGTRPKLFGSKDRDLFLIYTDDNDKLCILQGRPNSERDSWSWDKIQPKQHSIYGDALLDLDRWKNDQIISIYGQVEPKTEISTNKSIPVSGLPTPLKVIDYVIEPK